ncbi:MAG: dipeptidase [Ignavibacteria bacterium]|nr:dipeptidase [Ignavibacteria bacterium]
MKNSIFGHRLASAGFLFVVLLSSCVAQPQPTDEELRQQARELSRRFIIADTHIDVPYRLQEEMADVSLRTVDGDFDYPRALEGGLDLAFMSIYVPASYESNGAKKMADTLIDLVERFWTENPQKFAPALTVAQGRENHGKGVLVSLPLGMENGSPVEHKLENLAYFYDRGIRYITLAHSKSNHICDSSYDLERKWNGLSPFGKDVVTEMNRLGIMVDVSHISDSAFYQVIGISKAPVIASHSSCRHFTPGWERNMSDEMIRALAGNGGVIQINFGSAFLVDDLRKKWNVGWKEIRSYLDEHNLSSRDEKAKEFITAYREEHGIGYADIGDVIAHIEHVIRLVGVDHVGLGSDFDGVGDSLPTGLKDVSMYPNIIYELLKRGYSEGDIRKICGGNLLRVWEETERIAAKMQTDD